MKVLCAFILNGCTSKSGFCEQHFIFIVYPAKMQCAPALWCALPFFKLVIAFINTVCINFLILLTQSHIVLPRYLKCYDAVVKHCSASLPFVLRLIP